LGSIKVQIKEIQDYEPFWKRSVNLGTQLSEIRGLKLQENQSLGSIKVQNEEIQD
jgi:hypothetical protein